MTLRDLLAKATKGPWNLVWWGNETFPYPLSILADEDGSWITRGGHVSSQANARLIALAPQLAEALIEVRERLSRLSRWLDTDAEILADLSDAVFADHHHICGEIAATLASIDAIMESRDDG